MSTPSGALDGDPIDPIDRLQRLAVFQSAVANGLGTHAGLGRDLVWLGSALNAIGSGEDPARALGLQCGPGERRAHTVNAHRQRDAHLREIFSRYFAGLTVTAGANSMLELVARAERRRTPPQPGTAEAAIAEAAAVAAIPRSSRRLRSILKAS